MPPGNRLYSKSIAFEDRSYAEASDDDKAVIFELYCRLVNYFGPTVGFQLSVVCYYPDMAEYPENPADSAHRRQL